jgi:hypothetical protein
MPSLFFGFLLSTLYGAGFHVWRGGRAGRFLMYLLLAWVGFWSGQLLAVYFNITFGSIGQLRLGMATLTSVIFLSVGHWLSLVEIDRR